MGWTMAAVASFVASPRAPTRRLLPSRLLALLLVFVGLSVFLVPLARAGEKEDEDSRAALARLADASSIRPGSTEIRVAELLLRVRNDSLTGAQFFARLKAIPAGMKEVREVRTAVAAAGLAPAFLGARFAGGGTPVERTVLEHRRRVTERLILETIRSQPAGATVFVAKVGKWASQAADALTFDGDIDFSFIAADMRVAAEMKKTFDALLVKDLGLAAAAHGADVVATTHGMGDSEVYTGDAGQGFAEQALEQAEAAARAKGEGTVYVERSDGKSGTTPSDMARARARIAIERGFIVERSARLPDVRVPSDPGLSMEMVRHLLHDIKGSKEYPPSVLVVKASKYLQRSDQSATESGVGRPSDFGKGADEIVRLSKEKDASLLADHLAKRFGGDGVIDAATADGYIADAESGIWRNVEQSIRVGADGLEKRAAEAERATGEAREKLLDALHADVARLHDTIAAERLMLESAHVAMPATVEAQISRVSKLVDGLRKTGRHLTDEDMRQKRFVEEMLKAGRPHAVKLALATLYHRADRLLDEGNAKLDFIDDWMFGKLRGDRDFETFIAEMKETDALLKSTDPKSLEGARVRTKALGQRAKQGIADVNRRLNEAINSNAAGRGAMKGLMLVGLAEELPLYWNTFWAGDWDGLAMEFLRHRMPVFAASEKAFVDGNPSDYAMLAWDSAVALVPPAGLAQVAVGFAADLGRGGYALYWDEKLQVFVDRVYAGARFTPVEKTREGDAWFATWRLAEVKFGEETYDLRAFAQMRREQLKQMAAELRKPRATRDLSGILRGNETGLIDAAAVDRTLRQNLAAADPQLHFLEQLSGHRDVGPALEQHYADQKRVRWEEVKLAFLVELVDRLETRWAREWAAKSGQMDALLAELKRITGELEITREVEATLAAARPGRISLLAARLHALERDFLLKPDAVSAVEEEVGRIQAAIEVYRELVAGRGRLETRLGTVEVRNGGLRLLNGPALLTGRPDSDRTAAAEWTATADRLGGKAEEELKALKVRVAGGAIDTTVLEPGFDTDVLKRLTTLDVWRYAWAKILAAGDAVKRPGTLDDPAGALERLKAARAALLEELAAHWRTAGVLEATVVDATTGAPLAAAELRLGAGILKTDGAGRAEFHAVGPGRWTLSGSARDHQPGEIAGLVFPVPAAEAAGNRRAVTLSLKPAREPPRLSSLDVLVAAAPDGKPIAGATVSATGPDGRPITRATGGDGRVRFDGLAPGAWSVAATAAGREPVKSDRITLPVGATGPSHHQTTLSLKATEPAKPETKPPTDEPKSVPDAPPPPPETKTADGDTPKTVVPVTPETPPETKTDGKKKIGLFDGPAPVIFPPIEVATWSAALYTRQAHLRLLERKDLTPDQTARAKSALAAVEAHQKAFWDAAVTETKLAEEHLGRERKAVADAYAGFRARAPAASTGKTADGNATVTDLEGNTPPDPAACRYTIDSDEHAALNRIAIEIDRVLAARKGLTTFSPEWTVYEPAMRGWDQTSIDEGRNDWRKGGLTLTVKDPCGGPDATITLPAVKTPDVAATQPVAAPEAISAKLALAPGAAGMEVEVVATASGGRAPYRFDFVGARRADGPRATYARPATKNDTAEAVVKVTDADGRTATAKLPLTAAKVAVDLVQTEPSGRTVPVGGTARFRATTTVDRKPADPKAWVLRWDASSGVRFEAEEGAGVDANTATFQRPGKALIWVVALARDGAALRTAGESRQIEIEVVAPGLALVVEPPNPFVGEEVKVTARETPEPDPASLMRRWSLDGEAEAAGPTADDRVYSFVAKSAKPVKIAVETMAKPKGERIGTAETVVTPRLRTVTAANLGPAFGRDTEKIVLWKQGQGLVRLERAITAFMDVTLKATIEPAPADPVRWSWSLNEGSSFSGNASSQETRVQRATPGTIEAKVVARDARGIELGNGTVSVAVTVSDAAVREGRQKEKELAAARSRGENAWSDGDVDGACSAGEAARAIEPGFAAAANWCGGRDRIRTLVGEIGKALAPPTAEGLRLAEDKIRAIGGVNPKSSVLADLRTKIEAAKAALKRGEEQAAERKRRLDLLLAGAEACRASKWKECRETIARGLDGGETVFRPDDARLLDKARLIAAQAADAEKEAERKLRLDLLLAGVEACRISKWKECRETIVRGLDGGETVFRPEDARLLDEARAIAAQAATAEKKAAATKQATEGADADRRRRLQGLKAVVATCAAARWRECHDGIETSLAGGEGVFRPEDVVLLDKARALAAKAESELRNRSSDMATASPNGVKPRDATPSAPAGGRWERVDVRYQRRNQPCPGTTNCLTGFTQVDQGADLKVWEAAEDHVTTGLRVPPVQPNWSRVRIGWDVPPPVLEPGRVLTFTLTILVETGGWANADAVVWFQRAPGFGGGNMNLGRVQTSLASPGASGRTEPWTVPAGSADIGPDTRLRLMADVPTFGQVVWSYRWNPGGAAGGTETRSAPAPQPGATPIAPPAVGPRSDVPGRNGIYRGTVAGVLASRPQMAVTFTVAGDRITMVREIDPPAGHGGRIGANGDFVIEFPNNRWTGRVVDGELTGTWTMATGVLTAAGRSGSLRARRGG